MTSAEALEQALAQVEDLEHECGKLRERNGKLDRLAFDCLSVICGWAMAINSACGHEELDSSTAPSQVFAELQSRAVDLEVPGV